MALRVLLADESSTIKKVFQLALQDFAVEVRPVNVGVDVLPVAQSFKPDIIFADVLLQKRSGYEVASELKQDNTLKGVPVVLMWSGFMELDQDKFDASMANGQLEKPFDVAALRKLVTDLVPRTQSQRLSQFLDFPKMPEMEEKAKAPPPPPAAAMNNEEFSQVPLPKIKSPAREPAMPPPPKAPPTAQTPAGGGDKYRLNLKPEEMESDHVPVEYELPSEKVELNDVLKADAPEDEPFAIKETRRSAKPLSPPNIQQPRPPIPLETEPVEASEMLNLEDLVVEEDTPVSQIYQPPVPTGTRSSIGINPNTQVGVTNPSTNLPSGGLSAEQLEKIIREQSAEVIESVVWKVVPDLAAQIIERELTKLLKDRESQPY